MNTIEQVAYATDVFVRNGRTHTDVRITKETQFDEVKDQLNKDFSREFIGLNEGIEMADYFFVFSKWALYKTVYRLDDTFSKILIETEDLEFHSEILKRLPFNAFFLSSPNGDGIGYYIYTETGEYVSAEGRKTTDTLFSVVQVSDVRGEKMFLAKDILWISEGQKVSDALHSWMEERKCSEFYDRAYKNILLAIYVSLYLASRNADIKSVAVPKERRPRWQNGKPMNLQQWEVGYRIGKKYLQHQKEYTGVHALPDKDSKGNSPRPHVRRAHWHHYWSGPGKTVLVVKWLLPTWVNGSDDDIIAVEHEVV